MQLGIGLAVSQPRQRSAPPSFPDDIANLAVWLKADALSLSNADPVASWTDSSGNARHATQGTAGARPTYRTNVLNGKPVVRFDGVDDRLACATFALAQPFTRVSVMARTGNAGAVVYYFDGDTVNTAGLYKSATDEWHLFAGADLADGAANTSFHILVGVFNGASSNLRVDSGAGTTGNAGAGSPNGLTVGSAAGGLVPGACDVAEVAVYSRALTTAELNRIGAYLAGKYGVTWSAA